MPVAERVKQLRRELGQISQAALASRIGVTANAVAAWEQGVREPDAMNCLRLAALSSGQNAQFFAQRAGVVTGELNAYTGRTGFGAAQTAGAQASLARKRRREARSVSQPDPARIEAVVKKTMEARLTRLEERVTDGFARIERLLSSLLEEPAGPGVRVRKAITVRSAKDEKERAQEP